MRPIPAVDVTHEAAPPDLAGLLSVLEGCNNPGVTRDALLVRVPDIPAELRRPQHLRLIEAALDPLRDCDRWARHELPDHSLVITWRGPALMETRAVLAGLDALFADLPNAPHELLALPRDVARLAKVIAASVPEAQVEPRARRPALTAAELTRLEAVLAQADVTVLMRRRPVCQLTSATAGRLAWDRQGVNVMDLATSLAPKADIHADPWLFRRLTNSVDRRLLAALSQPYELRNRSPFSLALNLASVLEPEFLRFDAALPPALRGRVTIDLLPDAIIADPITFTFVRDFLKAREYNIGLHDLPGDSLAAFPPSAIGADILYLLDPPPDLQISPDLAPQLVLCGITDITQVTWGLARGVTHFEGPAIRPDPAARRLNLHRSGSEKKAALL